MLLRVGFVDILRCGGGGGGGGGGGSSSGGKSSSSGSSGNFSASTSRAAAAAKSSSSRGSSSGGSSSVTMSSRGGGSSGGFAGYGQDYNNDGRVSFGETLRDMTDRGGPGQSGGVFQGGGMLSTAANVVTGGFGRDDNNDGRISLAERARDMLDGGGAGQSGDRFVGGGAFGAIGNVLGGPQAVRGFFSPQSAAPLPLAGASSPGYSGGGDGPNALTAGPLANLGGQGNPLEAALQLEAPAVTPAVPAAADPAAPAVPGSNLAYLLNPEDVAVDINQGPLFQEYLAAAQGNPSMSFQDYLQGRFAAPMAPTMPGALEALPQGLPQGIASIMPTRLIG